MALLASMFSISGLQSASGDTPLYENVLELAPLRDLRIPLRRPTPRGPSHAGLPGYLP